MQYKLIPKNRFENVITHLRESFFADEPLNKAVGLCTRGTPCKEVEHHCSKTLAENLSIMAVSDNDEVIGVMLSGVLKPGDVERYQKQLEKSDDEKFKKIFTLIYSHHLSTNIFEKFNVDRMFELRLLSVDREHRRHGISAELLRRSEGIANDGLFKVIKADCTGSVAQELLTSNGFKLLSEIYYDKYTDKFGKPILPVKPPNVKLQLLYKILN